jgi:hypothetical protein
VERVLDKEKGFFDPEELNESKNKVVQEIVKESEETKNFNVLWGPNDSWSGRRT